MSQYINIACIKWLSLFASSFGSPFIVWMNQTENRDTKQKEKKKKKEKETYQHLFPSNMHLDVLAFVSEEEREGE